MGKTLQTARYRRKATTFYLRIPIEIRALILNLRRSELKVCEIVDELNERGLRQPSNARWTTHAVQRVFVVLRETGLLPQDSSVRRPRPKGPRFYERVPQPVEELIIELRLANCTQQEVAGELNRRGLTTPVGRRWTGLSVGYVCAFLYREGRMPRVNASQNEVPDPTPKEIEERAKEVRDSWDHVQLRDRCTRRPRWMPQVVSGLLGREMERSVE